MVGRKQFHERYVKKISFHRVRYKSKAGEKQESTLADEIVFLPRKEYQKRLVDEIKDARKSVYAVMYLVSVGFWKGNEMLEIMDNLIEASRRGVDVKVLLEDPGSGFILECNAKAAEYLLRNGIAVKFDDVGHSTHTKLVIIDDETSLLGSHNWTLAGLNMNYECSVMVRSRRLAEEYSNYFDSLWSKGYTARSVIVRKRDKEKRKD